MRFKKTNDSRCALCLYKSISVCASDLMSGFDDYLGEARLVGFEAGPEVNVYRVRFTELLYFFSPKELDDSSHGAVAGSDLPNHPFQCSRLLCNPFIMHRVDYLSRPITFILPTDKYKQQLTATKASDNILIG